MDTPEQCAFIFQRRSWLKKSITSWQHGRTCCLICTKWELKHFHYPISLHINAVFEGMDTFGRFLPFLQGGQVLWLLFAFLNTTTLFWTNMIEFAPTLKELIHSIGSKLFLSWIDLCSNRECWNTTNWYSNCLSSPSLPEKKYELGGRYLRTKGWWHWIYICLFGIRYVFALYWLY